MKYRPEVDGLRAVAVLPVILYHAGSEVFSGGFVGVDVFFVISGYLITGLLLEDMDGGRFSLWRFYERRARRILPALIAVILPCLVLGWFVMLPDPYENLGQSVVATLVFGNNLLVYLTSGYWGPVGEFRPLLHTWSLGVEEQFYVVAPLVLFAVWRVARGYLLQTVLLLWGISLARNLSLTWTDWDYAFLMIDTRAWQLLTGAAVLLAERRGWLAGNGWLACAGLVTIGVSVFGFSVDVPYPGYAALLPTLGAAAVIGFSGAG
ncbi:MAG: acyltransferase, partial [Mameliella sp.]|nr:acyltransferase [Mameliella sp.]